MRRALIVFCLAVFSTAAAHADPLQNVAKRLSKKMSGLKPRRIAVLTFPYHNGDISNGSSIVSERLTTLMVQRGGAEVVERALLDKAMGEARLGIRSEEHTSELQSPDHLVCRLLLEKKKTQCRTESAAA